MREEIYALSKRLQGAIEKYLPNFPKKELLALMIAKHVINEMETLFKEVENNYEIKIEFKSEVYVSSSLDYIRAISRRLGEKLDELLRRIRAYKIIAVIGAGASFEAGIPLTRDLEPILKQILGEKVLEQIEQQVKQTGKDPLKECFKIISNDKRKDSEFKKRFRELIEAGLKYGHIEITEAQKIIVEEFIKGKVVEIICLNWDNLLEICYRKIGKEPCKINRDECPKYIREKIEKCEFAHCIWKFHGDVEDLEYEWIYPGMEGRVLQTFKDYYNNKIKKSKTTFIVLVLGYSEADEEIKKNIIEFLEENHTIYRIGMSLDLLKKYDNYIFAPLEWIVPFIFGKSS